MWFAFEVSQSNETVSEMEKRNVEYDLVWWLLGVTRIDLQYIIVNTKYNVTTIFGS